MAQEPRKLEVVITPMARRDLHEIWRWNAENHNPDHADTYVEFLLSQVDLLSTDSHLGRTVPSAQEYRYTALRKHLRGHSHIAVYQVHEDIVEVLHFYHSAQNWRARLKG
jgi:plasmid stabilization system protein ParE